MVDIMEIKRDKYLKMLEIRKNNGLVKVITGIRRCGKSYLLNEIFYNNLITQGIKEDHIIRFAFDSADDLALLGIDIQQFISSKIKVDPQIFLAYISKRLKTRIRIIFCLMKCKILIVLNPF